jgi:hypothetical protein
MRLDSALLGQLLFCMRIFESGATRDSSDGKLDYEGFLCPLVIERFARYMDKHGNTPRGRRDSDNWQLGIPRSQYMKSLWRHFFDTWALHRRRGEVSGEDDIEEALCAVMFNAMGYLREVIVDEAEGVRQEQ